MNEHLYVEQRAAAAQVSLSWDIAHHFYARFGQGKTCIIAKDPGALLASISRQWHHIVRQVQRERYSTLNADRVRALASEIARIEKLRFTTKTPSEEPSGDVFFIRADALKSDPPACSTMYITCPVSDALMDMITSQMARHGLVVLYI